MNEIVVAPGAKRWAGRIGKRLPDLKVRLAGDGGWPGGPLEASGAALPAVVLTSARQLRRSEGLRRQEAVPVAVCRSHLQARQALQQGAFEVLVTPFSDDQLELALFKALRRRKSLRQANRLRKEKARLSRLNTRRKNELHGMWEIGKAVRKVTSSLDIEEILTSILWGLRKALELDKVVLGLVNSQKGIEGIKLALGIEGKLPPHPVWPLQDPVWERLEQKKGPILVDPQQEQGLPEPIAAIFAGPFAKCPLIVKGQVLGTIMCDRSGAPVAAPELRLLRIFSEYAAIAIQNGRLYYDVIRSEEKLRQAHEKLLAAEKMALIGHMAVSINHEINNPLCNISLITQTVANELGDSSPRMRRLLRDVDENVERIQQVTRKISGMRKANLTEYLPDQMMVDLQ